MQKRSKPTRPSRTQCGSTPANSLAISTPSKNRSQVGKPRRSNRRGLTTHRPPPMKNLAVSACKQSPSSFRSRPQASPASSLRHHPILTVNRPSRRLFSEGAITFPSFRVGAACSTPLAEMTNNDVRAAQEPRQLHFRKYPCVGPEGPSPTTPVKPPLVILHGLLGQSINWSSIAAKGSLRQGRDVYAVDLRNHGQSPHCGYMDYIAMSNDVASFIQNQVLGPPTSANAATIVGHSMGGKVAAATALRFPDITAGVLFVDILPIGVGPRNPESIDGVFGLLHAVQQTDLSTATERTHVDKLLEEQGVDGLHTRQWLLTNLKPVGTDNADSSAPAPAPALTGAGNNGGSPADDSRAATKPTGRFQWRCNIDALVNCYDLIRGFDLAVRPANDEPAGLGASQAEREALAARGTAKNTQIASFHKPTHLILGGDSRFGKPETAAGILRDNHFPECTLGVVEGAGHWVHAQKPQEFTAQLLGWLEKHGL